MSSQMHQQHLRDIYGKTQKERGGKAGKEKEGENERKDKAKNECSKKGRKWMKKRRLRMDIQEYGKIGNDKKKEGRKSEVRELLEQKEVYN